MEDVMIKEDKETLFASFQITDESGSAQVIGTELCVNMDGCGEDNAGTDLAMYSLFSSTLVILSIFSLI